MPKIRTKQIYKLNDGSFIKKSGILTRSLKSAIKKENEYKSFFKDSFYHNSLGRHINSLPYNDNNTVDFIEKTVNNTFPVEEVYKLNNKILHTPNEFDTSNKINKIVTSTNYNMFLKENYIDDNESLFNDSTILSRDELSNNEKEIRINLSFSEPCRLSFNKDSNSNQTVNLDNTNYNCINAPVVYYNFEDKKWDYLGDIEKNYYNSITDFKESPIAFNSINTTKTNKISSQSLGYPINTFGFPFDDRYQGLDRHLLKANKYITKPFLLEKIKIKFKGSSRAETDSNLSLSILNSLNFFIINQRKNLNKSSFTNLSLDSGSFNYFTVTQVSGSDVYNHNTESITYSVDEFPAFSSIQNTGSSSESISLKDTHDSNSTYSELSSSQRELISYLSIVNFASGGADESSINIDIESIRNNSDYIHEDSSKPSDTAFFAKCNYDKTIEVIGDIKTPSYNKKLESFSSFNIYPFSKYTNRTGTEYNTERSEKSDYTISSDVSTSSDDASTTLSISKNSSKSNHYVLLPSDELILGFSFNPSMKLLSNNKIGRDVYLLNDIVEVSLIGNYYQKEKKTKTNRVTFKNNSYKKINYFDSVSNTDEVGMNNIYLNKGAYYDAKVSKTVLLTNGEEFTLTINNVNSGAVFESSNTATVFATTFTNFKKLIDSNEEKIDTLPEGSKDNTHQYLSYFNFGHVSDRLNHNRFSVFKDLSLNKTYYTVLKKFRDKAFNEIDSTKSYNSNKYSRLDVSFKET